MKLLSCASCLLAVAVVQAHPGQKKQPKAAKPQKHSNLGPSAYTAAPYAQVAPSQAYYSGYERTQTSVQPQPVETDSVSKHVYPLNLTQPLVFPSDNTVDPVYLPPSIQHPNPAAQVFQPGSNFSSNASLASLKSTFDRISSIIANSTASTACSSCIEGLVAAQELVREWPWEGPSLVVNLCNTFAPSSAYGSCVANFGPDSSGGPITQVLYYANFTAPSQDGLAICAKKIGKGLCPLPSVAQYDASKYFNTTRPDPKQVKKIAPSGKKLKVLHLSDFHLDPRYMTGSESACSGYLCCRSNTFAANKNVSSVPVFPAPRFGAFKCDTPYSLALAAMEAIPILTGTEKKGFAMTLFTGDLVSHDNDNALSREYVSYTENAIYNFFRTYLGSGPVYAALGNHDSWPQALAAVNKLPAYLANQYSYNYQHVASLWQTLGWLKKADAEASRSHYGGFSVLTKHKGLRVISYNSDFLYSPNLFNYINYTNPDNSGMLQFVASELQHAENAGERVFLVSHIPGGWDGSTAMLNPSDLLQQIMERYSDTIAAAFQGHIHDEAVYLNFKNNGTISEANAAVVNWIGPSLTPLTNLNSGFRMYEVDSKSFEIMDAYTWFSNVTSFAALDSQVETGPSYNFEYSTREAYGSALNWPVDAPLNATWWYRVTEQMKIEPALVESFQNHQGRLSTMTGNCTSTACQAAKICYIRSSTTAIGQNCTKGYSSVQSKSP